MTKVYQYSLLSDRSWKQDGKGEYKSGEVGKRRGNITKETCKAGV